MEITRNKVHAAMWDDEAEMIEAALDIALDLFEDYKLGTYSGAFQITQLDDDPRWNDVIKAEGVLHKLYDDLRNARSDYPKRNGAAIRDELRKALAPIARLGGA